MTIATSENIKKNLDLLGISVIKWNDRGHEGRKSLLGEGMCLKKALLKFHPDKNINENETVKETARKNYELLQVFSEDNAWDIRIEASIAELQLTHRQKQANEIKTRVSLALRQLETSFYVCEDHYHRDFPTIVPLSSEQQTILEAVQNNNLEILSNLLTLHPTVDINFTSTRQTHHHLKNIPTSIADKSPSPSFTTLLLIAIENGFSAVAKSLLEKGAKLPEYCTLNGVSPLRLAVIFDHLEIVKFISLTQALPSSERYTATIGEAPLRIAKDTVYLYESNDTLKYDLKKENGEEIRGGIIESTSYNFVPTLLKERLKKGTLNLVKDMQGDNNLNSHVACILSAIYHKGDIPEVDPIPQSVFASGKLVRYTLFALAIDNGALDMLEILLQKGSAIATEAKPHGGKFRQHL